MTLTLLSVRDDGKAYLRDAGGTVWSTRPPYDVELRAMLPDAQLPVPEAPETFATWDDAIASLCRRVNIKSPHDREKEAWEAERTGRRAVLKLLEDRRCGADEDWVALQTMVWLALHGDWLAEEWPEFSEWCDQYTPPAQYSAAAAADMIRYLDATLDWIEAHLTPSMQEFIRTC